MTEIKYSKRETQILCEEIKKKHSILDYIKSKGITILDRGNRSFILCPFHKDNDPSLCVQKNGDREFFYCFGCKKSGSIIDFYSLYEGVSLAETINRLGEGIDFSFDMSTLVDDIGVEECELNILELNSMISIHCFEYLSTIRSQFDDKIIKEEFDKMNLFYEKIDKLVIENNIDKLKKYYHEICGENFLTERLKKLEDSIIED